MMLPHCDHCHEESSKEEKIIAIVEGYKKKIYYLCPTCSRTILQELIKGIFQDEIYFSLYCQFGHLISYKNKKNRTFCDICNDLTLPENKLKLYHKASNSRMILYICGDCCRKGIIGLLKNKRWQEDIYLNLLRFKI